MITVDHLCFDYHGKRALDNVSFTIAPKTITALVGPNGAGKTTLLRCLAAMHNFTSGSINIDGFDVEDQPREIHQECSYLSDFFGLYDDLTARQCLTYLAWSRGCPEGKVEERIKNVAQKLQLEDCLNMQAGKLSRGLRQRLAIAQSIIQEPKVLFLDEPASGLDPEARHELSTLLLELQSHGMTIIVSSHILSELEDYSTHMLVINQGRILDHRAFDSDPNKAGPSMQEVYLKLMKEAKQNTKQEDNNKSGSTS